MHITSVPHGYYGSYAIVGAHLPIACGLAWAAQIRRSGQVTVCFFGDGTTNIGAFHEAVNLAAVWRLPVVFVCENNWYMEYTPIGDGHPGRAARRRPGRRLRAGPDRGGRQRRRRRPAGGRRRGPRGPGRAGPEPGRGADLPAQGTLGRGRRRVPARPRRWRSGASGTRCCCTRAALAAAGTAPEKLDEIDARIKAEPGRAGPAGPGPARSRPRRGVDRRVERRELAMAELTYRQAVAAALAQEMARDDRVVLLGEDVRLRRGVQDHHRAGASGSARTVSGTRRSPSRPSRARPWAPPWPGCGRSPRSCSPTSTPPAGTRWPTRSRRSGT